MKHNFPYLICMVTAALMLTACGQDEADSPYQELPYGEYPLQIGSVTLTVEPGTKVTENADGSASVWEWDGLEQIGVQIGSGDPGVYVLQSNQKIAPQTPAYWTSTEPTDITAWYPMDETVDLSDQSQKLAYVLNAYVYPATYNQTVNLTFTHQLAKVRVVLNGTQADEVTQVEVNNYIQCRNNKGTVITQDGNTGWITMHNIGNGVWEANVVPGTIGDQLLAITTPDNLIRVNGRPATVTGLTQLTAGAMHTINLTVGQQLIDLSTYEGTTLTVSGKTILKGNGQPKNLQVIVEPDTELTLQGVNLSYNEGPTIICQGTAHITLSGTNQLSPTSKGADPFYSDLGSGIEVRSSGTLTIESEPNATLTITRRRTDTAIYLLYGAGIGLYENANLVIKGGTITVTGGSPTAEGGANIGGFVSQNAGTITLEGGTFTLQDQCMLSNLVGAGSYGTCGTVTIKGGATVNGVTYTDDNPHTGPL